MNKGKVTVAFSGGKDSTAAVLLLKQKNFQVRTLFMKVGTADEGEKENRVRRLAELLGVPLTVVDVSAPFKREILDYFIDSHRRGLTPNPCALCNQKIKFHLLRELALKESEADLFATGHYADVRDIRGHRFLTEPREIKKSQIYFLSLIGPEKLGRTLFPLARITLREVRGMTRNLPLAHEKESQDVCFLNGTSLTEYLRGFLPELFKSGNIVDGQGNRIGTHDGILHFTTGQRRGTRFSSHQRMYVIKKDIRNNTLVLGGEKELYSDTIRVRDPVLWGRFHPGEKIRVKVRYLAHPEEVSILEVSESGIAARFREPVRAVTPGQIGVFYQGDRVMAAGHIVD